MIFSRPFKAFFKMEGHNIQTGFLLSLSLDKGQTSLKHAKNVSCQNHFKTFYMSAQDVSKNCGFPLLFLGSQFQEHPVVKTCFSIIIIGVECWKCGRIKKLTVVKSVKLWTKKHSHSFIYSFTLSLSFFLFYEEVKCTFKNIQKGIQLY